MTIDYIVEVFSEEHVNSKIGLLCFNRKSFHINLYERRNPPKLTFTFNDIVTIN